MTLEEHLANATKARDTHRDNFHRTDGAVTMLQALIEERDKPKELCTEPTSTEQSQP